MLSVHLCIFLLFKLNSVTSKAFPDCNTSAPFSKFLTGPETLNECERSTFPRYALQTTRDIVCYVDTKIINFYYALDNKGSKKAILLKEIHRCSSAPIQTFTHRESIDGLNEVDPTLHVMSFANTSSKVIQRALKNLEKFSANKKHQKYLVIIEEILKKTLFKSWLREIFKLMWQKNVLNVIVIFYLDKKVHIYTYNPFDPDNYFIKIHPRHFRDVYYRNLGNLHRYPIYVSMYVDGVRSFGKSEHGFDGVDGNLAELLEEKLNASFIYLDKEESNSTTAVSFLGFVANESRIDVIDDVINERVNLSMNSRWLYEQAMIENTNSYEQNNLCVIVPKAKQIPSFYNLFYTMEAETWIVSILFIVIVTMVYFIVQVSNKRVDRTNNTDLEMNLVDIWFYMLQSFFGDSLTRLPRSASLRLIIITWLSYSLIISSAFTGTLISKIAIPLYDNELEKIDQLKESGMDILILDYVYKTRQIWDATLFETLKDQLRFMNKSEFDKYLIKNTTGMAYALSESRADFEMARKGEDKTGRPFYHKMQDCLIYFPRGYIATIGSPYIGMINDILGRFFEAGFNKHWEEMAHFKARIKGLISDGDEEGEDEDEEDEEIKVILSVQHLESAFYLLFIGLSLSIVAFIGEHIYYYYMEKKRNRVVYLNPNLAIKYGYISHFRQREGTQ